MMPTNAGHKMLPLHSILNPALSGQPVVSFRQSNPVLASSSTSLPTRTSRATTNGLPPTSKAKVPGSANSMPKPKPQGPVNFAPFEDVGQESYRELSQFQVRPFGQIRQSCEHIPYSSSKKDFFEKTGRESIEVFKYEFRYNGASYTVMWDYNVGLVRMTPFFKCLGYAKTKPSQMLDKNPGLRDISPSITGGAVSAQGYWMPYPCARAVCATFCAGIAGALIPLFGPSFPSQCTPSDSPYYNEMVISQRVIIEATEDAARFRHGQGNRIMKVAGGISGPLGLGDFPLRNKRESRTASTFRLPSRPQPSRSQPLFTSITETGFNQRPVAASAPSTACEGRETNPFFRVSQSAVANRSALDRNILQISSSSFDGSPRMETRESERTRLENCLRPKRRRRVHDEAGTAYSPTLMMEAYGDNRPQQELEDFRAAAALLSLHREPRDAEYSSAIVVESSEDDFPERRHQKKRPKAHSF